MTIKDIIIALLNVAYRQDEFINDFTGAVTSVMNSLIQFCESVKNNIFFDSLDEEGAQWWEKMLNIVPKTTQTLADRRSKIQAKWLSANHNDIALIQRVCNSWKNGEIVAGFINNKIQLQFVGSLGIPSDLDALKASIEEIKPAHLPYIILFKYLLKKEIHHILTKNEMETYLKSQYCNVGIGE